MTSATRTRTPSAPTPTAQLTFYPDTILVTKYTGGGSTTHPVHPADVVSAFTALSLTTGFLPPNTLAYARTGGKIAMVLFIPAGKHTVYVETEAGISRLTIPMPSLIWSGKGTHYAIFALKDNVPSAASMLYHAPCSNVNERGSICPGNTPFPETAPDTISRSFRTFLLESTFNNDWARNRVKGKHVGNVLTLWHDLHTRNRRRFPLRTLDPTHQTLGGLIRQLEY